MLRSACFAAMTLLLLARPGYAQDQPMIGEVTAFGGNFAPRGWALCDGQLLAVSSNTALFSILGTIYGGDGRSTFALPDLRGRMPVGVGTGPGLSPVAQGQKWGTETVTLTQGQLPSHSHVATLSVRGTEADPDTDDPAGALLTRTESDTYTSGAPGLVSMASGSLSSTTASVLPSGGNLAHSRMAPFQAVNYIIALQGTFPSR